MNQVYLDFLYNGGVPTKLTIILVYFVFFFFEKSIISKLKTLKQVLPTMLNPIYWLEVHFHTILLL